MEITVKSYQTNSQYFHRRNNFLGDFPVCVKFKIKLTYPNFHEKCKLHKKRIKFKAMSLGTGIFSVSTEEMQVASLNDFTSSFNNDLDFVAQFPPELSDKFFSFLPFKDVMNCCKCCTSWRQAINTNTQWKERCAKRGWFDKSKETGTDHLKWKNTISHVNPNRELRFRLSPMFVLPPVASIRIEPLCDWALYFRQCLHLERNWKKGRYVIHKLRPPSINSSIELCNSAACDGRFGILGSSSGSVFIWSTLGVPNLLGTIHPIRNRLEVEKVRVNLKLVTVLYQIGLIRIYNLNNKREDLVDTFQLMFQMRVWGTVNNDHEFTLFVQDITDEQIDAAVENGADDDVEIWIRELFREDPWFESEFLASDMLLQTNETYLIVSGLACNCFLIWLLENGHFIKKVTFSPGAQVCYKMFLTEHNLYLSMRRIVENRIFEATFLNFIYNLEDLDHVKEIPVQTMTEEIRPDNQNDKRIAWVSQDSIISALDMPTQTNLFTKEASSYVDNLLVHGSYVIYHQYDGYIIGLNWAGETLYETEAHIGLIRGLQACNDFLVSGGDAMQLCVWNVHTGKKHHTVYHQPCRIEYLFVDETKIVTMGREDSPVLIGYW